MQPKLRILLPAAALFPLFLHSACSSNSVDTIALDSGSVQQTLMGHPMILPTGFSIGVFAQSLNGVRFMV